MSYSFSSDCDVKIKEENDKTSSHFNVGEYIVYDIVKEEPPEIAQVYDENLYVVKIKEEGKNFSRSKVKVDLVVQHITADESSTDCVAKKPKSKILKKSEFSCSICNTKFTRKDNLQVHMGKHNNTIFSCNFCAINYNNKGSLQRHLKIHTSNNPHSCKICDKHFTRKSHFERHNKTKTHMEKCSTNSQQHSNSKFTCDLCLRTYTHKCDLKLHIATHYNKGSRCPKCSKLFIRRDKFEEHERIHTGEKLHHCHICGKMFSTKGNLTYHLKTYHMDSKTDTSDITKYD